MKIRCFQLSVRGALQRWSNHPLFLKHKDGRWATLEESRSFLLEHLSQGHEFLPLDNCANWDWTVGCLGHESGFGPAVTDESLGRTRVTKNVKDCINAKPISEIDTAR